MQPYPLLFKPMLKPKVWGGRRLAELGKALPPADAPDAMIGESWELADLPESVPGGRSVIANGPLAGRTLRETIEADRRLIMGHAALSDDGGFPLLVKFLDARENLSVQVHPDEAYVAANPGTHLKSEAWYIVHAEPGAVIYKGVQPGATPEEFAAGVSRGAVAADLVAVPARPGTLHYLPAGTCHALGAGVVVAEVQTPSDTTFRVYDWGRTGRDLHLDEAMRCIRFGEGEPEPESFAGAAREAEGLRRRVLVRTRFFGIEKLEAVREAAVPVKPDGTPEAGAPEVWMMIRGRGVVVTPGGVGETALATGTTVLLPAALREATARLDAGAVVLRVTLPRPTDDVMEAAR